jgi:hypothetical protein
MSDPTPFAPSETPSIHNPHSPATHMPRTPAPNFVIQSYFQRRYGHPILNPGKLRKRYVAAAIPPSRTPTPLPPITAIRQPNSSDALNAATPAAIIPHSIAAASDFSERKTIAEANLTPAAAPLPMLSSAAAGTSLSSQHFGTAQATSAQRRRRIEYFARICTGRATPLDLEQLVNTILQSSQAELVKVSESMPSDVFSQLLTDVAELHELERFNKEQLLELEKQIYRKVSRKVFAGIRIDWCKDREMNNLLVVHNPAFLSINFGVTSFGVAYQATLPWNNINVSGQPYFLAGSAVFSFVGQMIGTSILISKTEEIPQDVVQEGPPRRVMGCYNTECCYIPCSCEYDTASPRRITSALINSFGVVLKLNVKIAIDFYCIKSLYPDHYESNAEGKEICHDSDDLGFALKFILPAAVFSVGHAAWFFYSPATKRRWALQSNRNWVDAVENTLNWLWTSGVVYAFGNTLYGMIARNLNVNPLPDFALEIPALAIGIPLAVAIAPRYKESTQHRYRPVRRHENSPQRARAVEARSRNHENRTGNGCGLKRNEIWMFILHDIMTLTYLSTLALSMFDIFRKGDDDAKYWAKVTLYGYGLNFLAGNIFSLWTARESIEEYRIEETRVKEREWIFDETDRIRRELKLELRPIIEKNLRLKMGLVKEEGGARGSVDSMQAESPASAVAASARASSRRAAPAAPTDTKTAEPPLRAPLRLPSAPQPEPAPRTEAERVRQEWRKKKRLELTFWVTRQLEIEIREELEKEIRLSQFNRGRTRMTSDSLNSPHSRQFSIPLLPQYHLAQAHPAAQPPSPVSSPTQPVPRNVPNTAVVATTSATATAITAAGVAVPSVPLIDPPVRLDVRRFSMAFSPDDEEDDDEDMLLPLEAPAPLPDPSTDSKSAGAASPTLLHAYRGHHPVAQTGSAGSIRTIGRRNDREGVETERHIDQMMQNAQDNIADALEHAESPTNRNSTSMCAKICGWFNCR